MIPDFSISPEFDVKNASGHFVAIPTGDGNYTGLVHIDGDVWNALNTSNVDFASIETNEASNSLSYDMNFTLLQTADNFTILMIPGTNLTMRQVEELFLNVSGQVQSYDGTFFPNEEKYNYFDLSAYTISYPVIEIVSFPKPAYLVMGYLTGTSHEGYIRLLTTDLGGHQSTLLFMEFFDDNALELLEEVFPGEESKLEG